MTSTVLPFNAIDSVSPFGLVNSSYGLFNVVEECIKEHKDGMEKEGLLSIYIRENEDFPSVLFTLKADSKPDYNYWNSLINLVTERGAEYVSCYHEDDPLLKLDKGLKKFII